MIIRAALAVLLVAAASQVFAQDGFYDGRSLPDAEHDSNAPGHWYPANCCSRRDCEPIPIDGIEETKSGWRVHYVSAKLGVIDEIVPRRHARVKPNEHDGGFHGCWRKNYPSHVGAPGPKPSGRMLCFWYPVNV